MKNLWRGFCLVVFVTGVITFSQTPTGDNNEIEQATPYRVITVDYRVSPDGSKSIIGERIRHVSSNGEWRQTRYDSKNPSSKDPVVFASTDEGVSLKAPGIAERKLISPSANQQMQECFRSAHCLGNQLDFVRMDEVAGLQVYVLRHEEKDSANPIEWVEESYSLKTGYIPLRSIKHFRDGSEMVMEATKVEFKDVPENLNADIKATPIK